MPQSKEKEIPSGAIQALSTGATGLAAIAVAFVGWWAFGATAGDWTLESIAVVAGAWIGVLLLAMVPLIAASSYTRLTFAKWVYGVGVLFSLGAIACGIYLTVPAGDDPNDGSNAGCAGPSALKLSA